MWWLLTEIWMWVLLAFILGWAANWFWCCRKNDSDRVEINSVTSQKVAPAAVTTAPAISESWKPKEFVERLDSIDDLKRIKGVGAVIEKTLHELGVYQFDQVARWDSNNTLWIENFLAFPGRIAREDWVNQAKTLAEGGVTDFSQRVDKGDVIYSEKGNLLWSK